jgi:hypothetical protein
MARTGSNGAGPISAAIAGGGTFSVATSTFLGNLGNTGYRFGISLILLGFETLAVRYPLRRTPSNVRNIRVQTGPCYPCYCRLA